MRMGRQGARTPALRFEARESLTLGEPPARRLHVYVKMAFGSAGSVAPV